MKSERKTSDMHLSKLRKRMRTVGILMLINVVFRYFLLNYLIAVNTRGILPDTCYFSMFFIYKVFFMSIGVLSVLVGIKMIRGKSINIGKYLISFIILDISMILGGFAELFFTRDNVAIVTFGSIGLEIVLPIIGFYLFKEATKNEEYRKKFVKESKLQKISFIVFLLIFIMGLLVAGHRTYMEYMLLCLI